MLATALLLGGAGLPPPGAANCSGCHGAGAISLAGMDAGALAASMLAYRDGGQDGSVMGRLMRGLSPVQIQAIAAWIAAQNG